MGAEFVRYTREGTMRRVLVSILLATVAVAVLSAQRGARVTSSVQCAANLGAGLKSKRTFCDVLIATAPADSVQITIPAHTGDSTLQFDLHNRFTVPAITVPGPLTFASHQAVVAVIRANGNVIKRAAVAREFRSVADLFDQIGGGGRPGGVKAVAPGPAEPISVTIPAAVSALGIVGVSLDVRTWSATEQFDSPGRPVAMVSNVRIQYRPR
jgi:hypothetical protein